LRTLPLPLGCGHGDPAARRASAPTLAARSATMLLGCGLRRYEVVALAMGT